MNPDDSPSDRPEIRSRATHATPDPAAERDRKKPSFSSTKDEPLATAGTRGSEDHDHNPLTGDRNAASVAQGPDHAPENDEATTEGPGPAEGRTDNKAGG